MKLPDGVTVHIGGRKFRGEVPDELAPAEYKRDTPAEVKPRTDGPEVRKGKAGA